VRQAQRSEAIHQVLELDQQLISLCQVHQQPFEPARPAKAAEPEPVDEAAISKQIRAESLEGVPLLQLSARRAAKRQAAEQVADAVEAEKQRRADDVAKEQAELDAQWTRLVANDPEPVLAALEAAFEDNEAPAAAVSCRDARVDIVMRWPALDEVVPERKAATTPSGNPTIHKRNKTERAELYLEALCSNVLATAKETFAVCPGLREVGLAVVRATRDPARGDDVLEPILLATVRRDQVDGIRWGNVMATAALLQTASGKIGMKGKGANKTLHSLDLADEPDELEFVRHVAAGLNCRVRDSDVAGIQLPVHVALA